MSREWLAGFGRAGELLTGGPGHMPLTQADVDELARTAAGFATIEPLSTRWGAPGEANNPQWWQGLGAGLATSRGL